MEAPAAVICVYIRSDKYTYIHVPYRLAKQCNITSGGHFLAYVDNGKLTLVQAEGRKDAT